MTAVADFNVRSVLSKRLYWTREEASAHDALAAHAYQQALREADEGPEQLCPSSQVVQWINNRAAEILESWLKGEK
jgi:hypothetical protein